MNLRSSLLRIVLGLSVLAVVASQAMAQGGPPWAGRGGGFGGRGPGRGPAWANQVGGPGRGMGMARQGGGPDAQFAADRDVFHALLQDHEAIRRKVKNTENGVETLTESDKPEIAAKIQEHVAAMAKRVEQRQPIHMRDPLFAEVFKHADKIHLKYEKTAKGVRVVETSDDPYVAKLIQAHGGVVSLFVKNGFAEAQKNHAVPGAEGNVATATDSGSAPGAAGCPRAGCPLAATGQCPRAAGQCPCPRAAAACPAGKNCPLATACPAGKDCPYSKACPAGKDCPNAKACPAGQACPSGQPCPSGKSCVGCPSAGTCPLSGGDQAPPLPTESKKPEPK